ncbi:MAG: phosphotyrosine protein phosphatase [Bdellovibrionales bacterium RIFOXYB1_FULL_37_110]|nr:MAG: phosphotyrosine protein phosphatase [Bdellovibrionales bacterium RIFOXYA1_FULL_38_20]OFZ52436.1 MAG: phosphotyrosine protein phosphatase [Bdellovibrionales bacterium RIFOXYC1_FULL_37_79]OFZ53540.1 MAG: phosphotyrosine protein phosphatase [Bdellovibrionales bacterium RIFOXYB2_FULL_36_6]OFZ59638.1 MAG: phosphotyrosine protein phosphatase [Bdellovibrionales bacterium RIFOXYB1_FULL_37_110]OFZ62565.1 MAG: phosphotyrosine protein phosphatase [Bdellovibrionales bacterium RIFOXYD1_FULL_36_51]
MKKVIFVCMGNICRSPAAEGVMQKMILDQQLAEKIYVDSAGTIGYHAGEKADARMIKHAKKRGYDLLSISRQFDPSCDFTEFDFIIAMDNKNLADLKAMDESGQYAHKIYKMTDFCEKMKVDIVPDPYYGGDQGFETVLDIVEDGCQGLLKKINENL